MAKTSENFFRVITSTLTLKMKCYAFVLRSGITMESLAVKVTTCSMVFPTYIANHARIFQCSNLPALCSVFYLSWLEKFIWGIYCKEHLLSNRCLIF